MMNKFEMLKEKIKINESLNLSDIDIKEIDKIEDLKIIRKKISEERILDFLKSVRNPYFFNINNRIVQIEFSNNDKTAKECIYNVIKNIYK